MPWTIRYRTHAPWQSETIEGFNHQTMVKCSAVARAYELSKSFRDVVLEYHEEVAKYHDGEYLSGPYREE